MTAAFDDAIVPREAIAGLEEAMTNDPKGRHVLAAAVASEAQAVITITEDDVIILGKHVE
jgi:predicted nucleic acid-binding protein